MTGLDRLRVFALLPRSLVHKRSAWECIMRGSASRPIFSFIHKIRNLGDAMYRVSTFLHKNGFSDFDNFPSQTKSTNIGNLHLY